MIIMFSTVGVLMRLAGQLQAAEVGFAVHSPVVTPLARSAEDESSSLERDNLPLSSV